MTPSQPLTGKTAVVTGASSGIGRSIARQLGAAGTHATLDVRDVAQIRALVEGAAAETGRLDIMVNNAGVSFPAKIADADPEHWRAMLETNVLALLAGSQAAIRA